MTLFLESCVFRHRTALAVRLLALLVALAYGWMAHANIVSTSHDPLRGSGHDSEQILVAQSGGHEHSHDNSETDDHSTEHQNGHQATDHSHDKPSVSFRETLIKSGVSETCAAFPSEVGDIQGGMPPCSVIL